MHSRWSPRGFVAGWAAAYVHGVNALDGLDHHTLEPLSVPIVLPPGLRRRDTATVTYRQSSRRARGELVNDIPVTSIWRTIVDLTRHAPHLTEAVVAVDAFLAARLVTRDILERDSAAHPRVVEGYARHVRRSAWPDPAYPAPGRHDSGSSPSPNSGGPIWSPTGRSST